MKVFVHPCSCFENAAIFNRELVYISQNMWYMYIHITINHPGKTILDTL